MMLNQGKFSTREREEIRERTKSRKELNEKDEGKTTKEKET